MGCLPTHLLQVMRNFPHNHNWRTYPDPPVPWMTKLEHTVCSTRDIAEHPCFNPTHTFIFILGRLCSCGLPCLLGALKRRADTRRSWRTVNHHGLAVVESITENRTQPQIRTSHSKQSLWELEKMLENPFLRAWPLWFLILSASSNKCLLILWEEEKKRISNHSS